MSTRHCPTCFQLYGQQANVHHHLPQRAHDRRVEQLLKRHAVVGGGKDNKQSASLLTRITRALYSLGVLAHSYAFISLLWRWIRALKFDLPASASSVDMSDIAGKTFNSMKGYLLPSSLRESMRSVLSSPEGQALLRGDVVRGAKGTPKTLHSLFNRYVMESLGITSHQEFRALTQTMSNGGKGKNFGIHMHRLEELHRRATLKGFWWTDDGTLTIESAFGGNNPYKVNPRQFHKFELRDKIRHNRHSDLLLGGLFNGFWLFVISQVGADAFAAFIRLLLRAFGARRGSRSSTLIHHLGRMLGAGISILVATHALGATTIVACIVSILALALEVARMWSANTRASVEIAADIGQAAFAAMRRFVRSKWSKTKTA